MLRENRSTGIFAIEFNFFSIYNKELKIVIFYSTIEEEVLL